MMFMAGSHPPFGAVYVFFINFVPGFVAFRNPFYKFAPSLWFAYAILIGFTINYFLSKFSAGDIFIKLKVGRAIYVHAVYFAIIVVIVAYSFPFLNGSFLDYIRGRGVLELQFHNMFLILVNGVILQTELKLKRCLYLLQILKIT